MTTSKPDLEPAAAAPAETITSASNFIRDIIREDRSEEHTSELQSQSNLVCRLLLEKKKLPIRSEEHTSELQSQSNLVCRLLLEKKKEPPTYMRHPEQRITHVTEPQYDGLRILTTH